MIEVLVVLFIFGLAVGSFLNVVIFRYKPDVQVFSFNTLRGRSKCPDCDKTLKWYELIPLVSFFIQGGKCRKCNSKISWQYPVVEFLTGLVFSGVPWFLYNFYSIYDLSSSLDTSLFYILSVFWVAVFCILILITWIDRYNYIIPNELNAVLGLLGVGIIFLKDAFSSIALPFTESFLGHYQIIMSPTRDIFINHLMGAFIGAGFFVLLILISKGRAMGWGDVKFAFAGGLVFGWPDIGLALIISFVIGGIFGALYIVLGEKKMGDKLPFAPFLTIGMVLTFIFGVQIVENYLGFIGM